jgi:hypothetical protein
MAGGVLKPWVKNLSYDLMEDDYSTKSYGNTKLKCKFSINSSDIMIMVFISVNEFTK